MACLPLGGEEAEAARLKLALDHDDETPTPGIWGRFVTWVSSFVTQRWYQIHSAFTPKVDDKLPPDSVDALFYILVR